jgi:hypothetical protein
VPQVTTPLLIPPLNQLDQQPAARAHGENVENAQEGQGLWMPDQRRITREIMRGWAPHSDMYGRLAYKFEGMADMINGAFMEDLSELLNSATGDQRRRKTFYEIDTEFEKMTASLLKNFDSMASLMPFLRASLRQTMIRKLANVGKDKDGWKKADEHLTTLMDQEHMITLEDTEAAIKRCDDSGAQVNILEGTLGTGTRFSLPVSQALQPRPKEQMPCSPYSGNTEAERADAVFPVLGEHVFEVQRLSASVPP